MKILGENKLTLNENILTESGKSAGDNFELGAAEWLNNNFKDTGYIFRAKQDTGHGDIECIYDGEVKFLVECKLGPAQAGQMSLKSVLNDDGTEIIEYDYTRDNNTTLGKLTSQILNLINKSFKSSGKPIDTAGLSIDNIDVDSDGDIGVEASVDEDNQLFQRFVKQEYLDNKPSTKFFIFDKKHGGLSNTDYASADNIDPRLCLTSDIDKVYKMSAKVRLKIDADSIKFSRLDDDLKLKLKQGFNAKDIVDVNGKACALLTDKVGSKGEYIITIDGITYHLNTKNDGTFLTDDGIAQEIRKRKEPRTIFIITLTLTKDGYNINQTDKFIEYLNKFKGVNEVLDMNKNLSEELIINDDISLGKDEEEQIKEIEKSAKEYEKEVNKELADKVDKVEEINEFEVKPIKGLTEKLILEEPSDILTEDFEDELNDDIFILADNISRLLKSFVRTHPELPDRDSVLEDAFTIAMNNLLMVNEEVLDEKIPADLAKAYKRANYTGRSGANTDLQNADYQEVDAATGYKLYKEDPRQVRLLIDGKLIDFRDNGYPSLDHRDEWLPDNLAYYKKNGQKIRDTLHTPAKHLFSVASKIYVTNEHKPEGQKDQDLLSQRRENPESRYGNVSDLKRRAVSSKYWGDPEIRGDIDLMNSGSYKGQRLNRYKKELKQYQDYIKNVTSDSDKMYYQQRIDKLKDTIRELQNNVNDAEARKRYANSERSLQKPLERYISLKSNINDLQDRVDRSQRELEQVRTNGSDESMRNRQKLTELQQRLKELRKQIAMVELDLEGTDEEDARAVAAAEAKYQAAMGRLGDAQAEINALLRRG